MKYIIVLSLITATMLFTGCEEKTEKVVETTPEVVVQETVKDEPISTLDAAKKSITQAAESAKEKAAQMAETAKAEAEKMADATAEKAAELKTSAQESISDASDTLKEKAEKVSNVASEAMASLSAPDAYAKCKGCHGADGKTVALGKSAVLAGQDKAALIASMNEYKAGTRNVAGMGALMKGQVASMSDEDIEAVADYLSSLK